MFLLLAPPNRRPPLREAFQSMWQNWVDSAQDFLVNDLRHLITDLIVILIFAWVALWLVKVVTNRMRRAAERHPTVGLARTAQIRTLASVLRATGIGIVGFFTVITILRDVFDLNLAPLLASASVAGVAIGLAAQTIIKDMINGMLVLVEDQYNVGDWITVAGVTGTVESMSLRKTSVRGGDGTLYLIPNSQITTVANQNRDFSVTTLNISVDFSANPDKVIALLKKVSSEVRQDSAYKDIFLSDPQVLGVDQIKGSEVIYPISVKTLARKQYDALREMQKRIRIALEDNDMLPGSPFRVIGGSSTTMPGERPKSAPVADPTTNKPNEINPFAPQ
ncbi:MAG TPA: mechanosensitive ion channel family protein [Acidobacteriaceae bacterium]|nr:mechanosensitive ion channel family protein [Acidobacteriaceae bacterium]